MNTMYFKLVNVVCWVGDVSCHNLMGYIFPQRFVLESCYIWGCDFLAAENAGPRRGSRHIGKCTSSGKVDTSLVRFEPNEATTEKASVTTRRHLLTLAVGLPAYATAQSALAQVSNMDILSMELTSRLSGDASKKCVFANHSSWPCTHGLRTVTQHATCAMALINAVQIHMPREES